MQTIKRIELEDYNHLAIVLDEKFILSHGIVEGDHIDLSDAFLTEGELEDEF